MKEQTLYESNTVMVTTARVVIAGTTYATANITSVALWEEPRSRTPILLGLSCLALGLVCVGPMGAGVQAALWLVAGAVCIGIYYLIKPVYWVRLVTSGGEANAVQSINRAWVEQLVGAINEAIIARG